jgi:hypothetical protein
MKESLHFAGLPRRIPAQCNSAVWTTGRRPRVACPAAGPAPKTAKLAANDTLRRYVQDRLAGTLTTADGTKVAGPQCAGSGGVTAPQGPALGQVLEPGADRRPAPGRLQGRLPHDGSMRIWHEAIYQALYVQAAGRCAAS